MYKQPAFNSFDSVNSFKNLNTQPLTHENLSKIRLVDPSETPLARYCSTVHGSQTSLKKKRHQDCVLESPRIVAFPYHNDSFFLPTAEHDYPGSGLDTASIASLSVHTIGSRSTLRQQQPPSPVSAGFRRSSFQRRMSATTRDHGSITSKNSRSLYNNKRRSASFSTVLTHSEQSSKYGSKRLGRRLKQGLLRFKSTIALNSHDELYSNSSSSVPSLASTKTSLTEDEAEPSAHRTWYKKLWKFIKPTEKSRAETLSPTDPVWYTQYKSNPSL